MSRLEELIQQYCPDGVEYKKLEECIKSLNTGLNPRQFFRLNTDDATNFYITIREIQHNTIVFSDKTDRINDEALKLCNNRSNLEKGDVLFSGTGTIGEVAALEETPTNWNIKEGVYSIKPDPNILFYRFLMYLLQSKSIKQAYLKKAAGGTVKSVPMGEMRKLVIPVPPLPVQEEIVRILDTLTELQAELQAELQKRLQQYNYYRDNLLSFEGRADVEWKKLGDMCSIKARIGWQRLNKSEYLTTGDYYLITGVDIRGTRVDFQSCYYVSKERYDMDTNIQLKNGDIILTKDGTIGKVALIENMDKPGVLNSHLFLIRDTSGSILAKYLMYILLSKHFQSFVDKNKTQGTIPGLNQATVVKFKLPIPSLKEQERIVAILDRFDKLTTDITAGLPAEIEARRKQYEYYRDQLLTFKKKA